MFMLCKAKKGRIGSHLMGFYANSNFKQIYPERFFEGKREPFKIENITRKAEPEDRLKIFGQVIVDRQQIDVHIVKVEKEVRIAYDKLSSNSERKRSYKGCFKVLLDRFKRLKTQKERPRYMIHAVLLVVFSDLIDWERAKWPALIEESKAEIQETFEKVQRWII